MHEDVDDDGELNNKYRHKKWNAKRHGLKCLLTFNEYADLAREAGIKSSDIGPGAFHLARHQDRGDYQIGNCRFIPYTANAAEKNPTDPAVLSAAMQRYYQDHPGSFTGKSHSRKTRQAIGEANSVAQAGTRNSQYGSCWITNGSVSKKIPKSETIPLGWRPGRAGANVN